MERRTNSKNLFFSTHDWIKIGPNRAFKDGDVIFVKGDQSEPFFTEVLPNIATKFILITHNSAVSVPAASINLDDSRLIHWFGQNAILRPGHPKVSPVPIGLENRHLASQHGNIADFEAFLEKAPPLLSKEQRPIDAYVNFAVDHHESRRNAVKAFPYAYKVQIPPPISQTEYLSHLTRTKFVVSPRGTGQDCHRTWEAVLLGAVPIVQNSTLWTLFKDAPVKVVNDDFANEIPLEELLKFRPPTSSRRLMMAQHWFDRIDALRMS